MAKHLTVEPGPKLQPGEVVLWEISEQHPDGEVLIAAPHKGEEARTYEVGHTPGVNARLADGRLIEARPKPEPAAPAPARQPAPSANIGGITDTQRDALVAAGYVTAEDIRKAADEDLKKVDGIGDATVARLRDATRE